MHPNIYSRTIYNSQHMKMWYTYTVEYYSAIKEGNNAINAK